MAWGDLYLYGWVNGDLQERLHQGRHSQTAAASATVPVLNSSWPMPPQNTVQHQQVTLVQSPVESLLLSSESYCLQGFVCALQDWSLCFPQSCGSSIIKSFWPSRSDSLGIPSPAVRTPGWKPDVGFRIFTTVGELLWYYYFPVCGSPTWQVWDLFLP